MMRKKFILTVLAAGTWIWQATPWQVANRSSFVEWDSTQTLAPRFHRIGSVPLVFRGSKYFAISWTDLCVSTDIVDIWISTTTTSRRRSANRRCFRRCFSWRYQGWRRDYLKTTSFFQQLSWSFAGCFGSTNMESELQQLPGSTRW